MAAATADREAKRSEGRLKSFPVATNTTIFKGTLVAQKSDGYLASIIHSTANMRFAGVAYEGVVNSGADGAKECRVHRDGEYEFVYNGGDAAAALVGRTVYAVDNQTVDEDPAEVTNEYAVGIITEVVSTTRVRVQISIPTSKAAIAQAAIASLTDNSGGAAPDGTIGAVSAPTALTDNGGGTADGTVASQAPPVTITDSTGLSGSHDDTIANASVPADITGGDSPTEAEHNAALAAMRILAQNGSDLGQKIIELVTLAGVAQNNLKELTTVQSENRTAIIANRDAVTELATKVNSILTALRGAGIIAQ